MIFRLYFRKTTSDSDKVFLNSPLNPLSVFSFFYFSTLFFLILSDLPKSIISPITRVHARPWVCRQHFFVGDYFSYIIINELV